MGNNENFLNFVSFIKKNSSKIINFDKNLAPVPGTREALHLVGLISKNAQKNNSIAALTNPFYHAWKAGAIESDSKIL